MDIRQKMERKREKLIFPSTQTGLSVLFIKGGNTVTKGMADRI
jgi:hypothetical protein